MGKQAFLEQLQQDADDSGAAREEDVRAWLRDLRELMASLTQWLADPRFAESLHVEAAERELVEEGIGPYDVPTLMISVRTRHPRKVHVLPRSMQVVGGIVVQEHGKERRLMGALGRVDLLCGPARETLLRFVTDRGTTWRWLRGELGDSLDEESFFEALRQLML